MNALTKDIRLMIEAEATYRFGVDLFIAMQPPQPVNCVTLWNTSSAQPDMTLDGDTDFNEGFQIIIRNTNYESANSIAYELIDILNGRCNELWEDTWYLFILLSNGPNEIITGGGLQDKKAGEYYSTLNFRVKRKNHI